ncbi:DUF1565 domain-containing protein [Flavobacterium circumlabens]|uniref:DUF1565 domain-containing protein n=1 Tax=Flavobacterium circumlabens TaxID=2133765 RepID=A0A4Y7U5X9_9FLAO|nr:DUF1565 domain-containing protein [Flavobacterium circumlabens]
MNRKKIILLFCILSIFCFAQTNYYVAPTGNNANSGSVASPWKTIQYGLNQLPANGILNVFPGTYSEKITIPNTPLPLRITRRRCPLLMQRE